MKRQQGRATAPDTIQDATLEELLERARSEDPRALEELFRRCRPMLGAWADRRKAKLRPGMVRPSDIAQSAAQRAFQKFVTFRGETQGEWTAWLREILENCIRESRRAALTLKRNDGHTVSLQSVQDEAHARESSPSQVVARNEQRHLLLSCLYRLPEDQGEAIMLCHLKGLSTPEAAMEMGKAQTAMGGLLARGMKSLRRMMNEDPDTGAESAPADSRELRATLDWIERVEAIWGAPDRE